MMRSKIHIAGMLLLTSVTLNAVAVNVEWNQMRSQDAEVWDTGPLWMIGGYHFDAKRSLQPIIMVTLGYDADTGWQTLHASGFMAGLSTISARQMSAGDVVSYETMHAPGLDYFYQTEAGIEVANCGSDIPIPGDDSIFLAFSTLVYDESGENYLAYGWVEVAIEGVNPVVLSSAWDVDGGAMYVGGGAVPEPAGGLLIALGLAALCLQRRVAMKKRRHVTALTCCCTTERFGF